MPGEELTEGQIIKRAPNRAINKKIRILKALDKIRRYTASGVYSTSALRDKRLAEIERPESELEIAKAREAAAWKAKEQNPSRPSPLTSQAPRCNNPCVSGNPKRREAPNQHDARELFLYIDSDSNLYRQMVIPIMQNLARKIGRGAYDKAKAVKLWNYLADEGAKRYTKEFGTPGPCGSYGTFTPATRFMVAAQFARRFMDLYRNKEYSKEIMKLGKGKSINPWASVKYPARTSRLFRAGKTGRWRALPKKKNPLLTFRGPSGAVRGEKATEALIRSLPGERVKVKFKSNPTKGAVLIGRRVKAVEYVDEGKARRCGMKNPALPWRHDFSSADAQVFGLPDGSVLIKSTKRKLWGYR
jgi:hypothetical protein